MNTTNVFQRLRDDHERVLHEIVALEEAADGMGGGGARQEDCERRIAGVVALLERQFATHMAAEERILYPALARTLPGSLGRLEPLSAEHAELQSMLDALVRLMAAPRAPSRDEQVAVQARDLVDLLRIHIRKEEAVVLSVAEKVLGEAEVRSIERGIAAGLARAGDGVAPVAPERVSGSAAGADPRPASLITKPDPRNTSGAPEGRLTKGTLPCE